MTPFLRKLLGMNWLLFASMLALAVFGVVAVYSATYFKTDDYWQKQAIWVGIGVAVFLAASLIDYRWVKWTALPLYLLSIVFLVLTYSALGEEHGGAKAWLNLKVITFQPSQLCVMAGILVIALFLSQFRKLHPFLKLCIIGAIVGGPMILILKQPDFGMTMVWVPVILAMLFLGGIPKRYLIALFIFGAGIALPLAVNFALKDYQRKRIVAFFDPEIDPKGTSWAINQSLIAIGSGGFSGKGFKAPNTQVEQGFLPGTTVHTDYIFSAIGEQWGFVGGVVLLGVFSVLLLCCLFTAYNAADDFGLLITIGLAAQIFYHVYQNVGMTIALMPITGLPLPLVSYGGTFIVMMMFGLGLVNSVWIHRKPIG